MHEDADEALRLATAVIDAFPARFRCAVARMRAKLGLDADRHGAPGVPADDALVDDLPAAGAPHRFHRWRSAGSRTRLRATGCRLRMMFVDEALLLAWLARWQAQLDEIGGDPDARHREGV